MEVQSDLQHLLERQVEIQRAMRRPGGIRITVERELQRIREQLKNFPSYDESAAVTSNNPMTPPPNIPERGN